MTIGTYSNHFTGNYDGNGYKITNLNFTGGHNVGLFSFISGNIENLVLENLSINSESRAGGLVGDNRQADNHIVESYSTGKVTGKKVR